MGKKLLCVGVLVVDIINDAIKCMLEPGDGVDTRVAIEPGGNVFNVSINVRQSGANDAQIACLGVIGNLDFLFEREMQKHNIIPVLQRQERNSASIHSSRIRDRF